MAVNTNGWLGRFSDFYNSRGEILALIELYKNLIVQNTKKYPIDLSHVFLPLPTALCGLTPELSRAALWRHLERFVRASKPTTGMTQTPIPRPRIDACISVRAVTC